MERKTVTTRLERGRNLKRVLGAVGPVVVGALALVTGIAKPQNVHADDQANATELRERCATRLSIAFLGKSPGAELAAAPNPQEAVDKLLADPAFIERFARFVNAEFNPEPGENPAEDASYFVAKYILTNNKPWKEMFVGAYDVVPADVAGEKSASVEANADGLGYFRSAAWMRRYAGNEQAGYRIAAAYRILQNTTGLALLATTNVEGVDLTAKGRAAAACAGCHFENWYALDKVSKILSKRKGQGTKMTFTEPTEGPQQILGGKTIANDKELVEALVASENFKFNTCRVAFNFLYGRAESTCEAKVFDACVDTVGQAGTMQAALATIAKDPTFCQ
jgi:hypothetical protein